METAKNFDNKFAIKRIDDENGPKHPRNPRPLPQHEFSMILVAAKGSGKTNLICNLLLNHYKGYFNDVWVCSPTTLNDEKWDVVKATKNILKENHKLKRALVNNAQIKKTLPKIVHNNPDDVGGRKESKKEKYDGKIPEENFFEKMDDLWPRLEKQNEVIEELRKQGHEGKSKYMADRVLVIIDDTAGLFKAGNFNNPFVNYMFKHRHYSTSVIVVTQAYKAVVKSARTGCNALILFEGGNPKEISAVYEEWNQTLKPKEWMPIYEHCVDGEFDFMYINSKFPKGERIYKNFESLVEIGTKINEDSPPPPPSYEASMKIAPVGKKGKRKRKISTQT